MRMHAITDRVGGNASQSGEFSATGILITLAIWFFLIPLLMWIGSLIYG
jgi:hypothetical protein